MPAEKDSSVAAAAPREFATTQWSMVLAAGRSEDHEAQLALSRLCESYWYPLYAYVRRRVPNVDDAQDLTQAFFAHLLEKGAVGQADPSRGRFRAFLLTALKNFLTNEWQKQAAQKRGGGKLRLSIDMAAGESKFQIEPAHELTAEKLFERRWVTTLLEQVLERLRTVLTEAGKTAEFEELKLAIVGDSSQLNYEQAGAALGITSAAAKQAAYRLRKRYRQLFREEVARTVAAESDVDAEIGRLLAILAE